MSNQSKAPEFKTQSGLPLVDSLVSSVQDEEAIIEQLLASLAANKPSAVMKAARELAAIRRGSMAENCAE